VRRFAASCVARGTRGGHACCCMVHSRIGDVRRSDWRGDCCPRLGGEGRRTARLGSGRTHASTQRTRVSAAAAAQAMRSRASRGENAPQAAARSWRCKGDAARTSCARGERDSAACARLPHTQALPSARASRRRVQMRCRAAVRHAGASTRASAEVVRCVISRALRPSQRKNALRTLQMIARAHTGDVRENARARVQAVALFRAPNRTTLLHSRMLHSRCPSS
jgi:hypothetical protein